MCDLGDPKDKITFTDDSGAVYELVPLQCCDPTIFQEHKWMIWSGPRSTGKSYLGALIKKAFQQTVADSQALEPAAATAQKK